MSTGALQRRILFSRKPLFRNFFPIHNRCIAAAEWR
jgi:hypothetical protein